MTREVFNQPEPLVDYNLFEGNSALRAGLEFNAPKLDTGPLATLGKTLGSQEMQTHARLHGTPWTQSIASPHVLRAASFMLFTELEPSILCPISMPTPSRPPCAGTKPCMPTGARAWRVAARGQLGSYVRDAGWRHRLRCHHHTRDAALKRQQATRKDRCLCPT